MRIGLASGGSLRVAIAGLAHGHVSGFLHGGALVPAGGLLHRTDDELVGIAEPDRALFEKYRARDHFPARFYFSNVPDLIDATHPEAVLIFSSTYDHTRIV